MAKRISILAAVAVSGFVFWLLASRWLDNPVYSLDTWGTWAQPLVAMIVFGAMLALAFTLLQDIFWGSIASLLSGGAFILIFGTGPYTVASLALMYLFHFGAMKSVRAEMRERFVIDPRAAISRGLSSVILPLLIVVSFMYYQSPAAQTLGSSSMVLKFATQTAEKVVPAMLSGQISSLPEPQRSLAQLQVKSMQEAVIENAVAGLDSVLKPFYKYAPPIMALGLFMLLNAFGFLFKELALLLGHGIFLILKSAKIFRVETIDVKAQRLVL